MGTPPNPINKGNDVQVELIHEDAKIPERQKPGDAGYDFYATEVEWDGDRMVYKVSTGVKVAIPRGFVGLITPRSSVYKKNLALANSVGVIDSGYRGEVKFLFIPTASNHDYYEKGDRIGQMIVTPHLAHPLNEVDDLSETERGEGGFGSTGEK